MESTEEEAVIKKNMIERAKRTILLADHHKFDRTAFVHTYALDRLSYLVTDREPSAEWQQLTKEKNIKLIY